MIVKMISDLTERMEAQTKKIHEMFNNELEDVKNRQLNNNCNENYRSRNQ